LNKKIRGLPPQGYDEFHPNVKVMHDDNTHTADWRKEWPRHTEESKAKAIHKICKDHPNNTWCDRYKATDNFNR